MPDRIPPSGRRFFTLDEANRMLPLIRHIVEDISSTAKVYERVQTKLDLKNDLGPSKDDRRLLAAELSDHADRLEDCLQELRTLGVEFKGWEGLVDFPAWVDGREVEYCWKQGEGEIGYWHELYAGYSNRRPLPVTVPMSAEITLGNATVEEYQPDDVTKVTNRKKAKVRSKVVRRGDESN